MPPRPRSPLRPRSAGAVLSRRAGLALGALLLAIPAALPARAAQITVFAAASMKTALDEIAKDWEADTGNTARISYAGSSQLAKQIAAGAPADLYISANVAWMDYVEDAGLVTEGSRHDLLGNALVLIGGPSVMGPDSIGPGTDLLGLLDGGKLAMALVGSVPAGIYGKQALTSLGLWDSVAGSVAQADNVRAALALVAAREAPYGITYATDAVPEPRVRVLATFPEDSHDPIVYPAALISGGTGDANAAADFLRNLSSEAAKTVFEGQGFTVLN